MAKGSDKGASAKRRGTSSVGPPVLLLVLAFASVLVSLPLIALDGVPAHVLGYVTGALVPILLIGFFRRVDLGRRRSPAYQRRGYVGPAMVVVAVAAVVAAGLHVWPIATDLAS